VAEICDVKFMVDSHYMARHGTVRYDTTRQNILLRFSHARIHTSPLPTANDKDSVGGIERREYFACLLDDSTCEGTLVFVVSCRAV
jgi:hypothetical protein